MNLSYNDLLSYLTCPLQYKWMKLGGYPFPPIDQNPRRKSQFIGHLLQDTVVKFYRDEWWRHPKAVLTAFRAAIGPIANKISLREHIHWQPGEYEHWIQVAQDSVTLIIDTIKREKLLGVKNWCELPVQVTLPSADQVYGRLDFAIDRDSSELILLDGKGGGTVGRYVDKRQLINYYLGCIERLHRSPTRVGFWWFRHGKMQWIDITVEKRVEYIRETTEAVAKIGQLHFEPTPGQHCRLCDFRTGCTEGQKFLSSKGTQLPDVDIDGNAGTLSL